MNALLPQVEGFKILVFISEGTKEWGIDRWTGAASAVLWMLLWSFVGKRKHQSEAVHVSVQLRFYPHLW